MNKKHARFFTRISVRTVYLLLSVATFSFGLLNNVEAGSAPTDETVRFDLPRAPLTPLRKKRSPNAQNIPQATFTGRLRIPAGDGPHPGMVVIRTCHDPAYYDAWLDRLDKWGFATLSFSRCQPPHMKPDDSDIPALDWKRGSLASFGALGYLSELLQIDAGRIGVMAWSRLGMIPLSTLQSEGFAQFFENRFAVGVALYPFCSFSRGPHDSPLLILAGGDDNWVDNKVCQRVARESKNDEFPATTIMLKGAVHGFDIPQFGGPRLVSAEQINPDRYAAGGGMHGYNKAAAIEAIERVRVFLSKHLK